MGWGVYPMSTVVYNTVNELVGELEFSVRPSMIYPQGNIMFYPYPLPGGVTATYLNKCIDGITGDWHFWRTTFQDVNGLYYLQSGGQQFDAATYKIQMISFNRNQV
jgi:hypothetical protein